MSIILNEYERAEKIIGNHYLGPKPSEALNCVAKYYSANGYTKKDIRQKLDAFLLQCDPSVSLPNWSDLLDRITRNAGRYPMIVIESVSISEPEMKRIEELQGTQIRRLAFALLCTAKYWDIVSATNNHWVNSPDKEIMQMANINTSIKRQSQMFAELRKRGFINFSKKIDNLNVQVLYIEPGATAMRIHDYRNLGYQYQMFYGGAFFECENCGLSVKMREPAKGRRQKYCPECAMELHTKQKINSVMRHREEMRNNLFGIVDKNDMPFSPVAQGI